MESTLEYLAKKHSTLRNDYSTPNGKYSESCECIAVEVAKRLLNEGKKPYIAKVSKELTPLLYEGRIKWYTHLFCCCNGLAYDPILKEPVPLKDYCRLVFGENIEITVKVPSEKIKEYIEM